MEWIASVEKTKKALSHTPDLASLEKREDGRLPQYRYVLCGTNLCLLEVDKDEVGRLVASSSHTLQTRTTERRKLKATPTASSSWLMCLTKVDSKLFNV